MRTTGLKALRARALIAKAVLVVELLPARRTAARLLTATLLAMGLATATAGLAHAAEPCAWRHPGKPSRLFLDDRLAVLRRYYDAQWAACAAPNGGRVTIEWRVGSDPQATPVDTDEVELRRGRAGDGPLRLEAKLFPNHVCDKRSEPRGKLAVTGLPGEERVSELVPVRARVVATGALAPLAFDAPPITVPCPACDAPGKRLLRVQQDHDGNLTLEAELDAKWFECARHGATLMLLGFSEGRTQDAAGQHAGKGDLRNAVRPQLVLRDLEKELTRKGDVVVLRKPLPASRLCATGKVWAFEFWGRGELARASGGGRVTFTLRCPR
ncbi:MAG: hypothetical protein RL685_1498 [Pseudomonadota bacterium]|jgi:hypothetical protein